MVINKLTEACMKNIKKIKNNWKYIYNNKVEIDNELILFLGFDYKYRGNSKYLFDFMLERNEKIIFVTDDIRVPLENRVSPNSKDFYNLFYIAKVVIAETWIPNDFLKRKNQLWIQLWHGTPIKKMLFDSFLNDGNWKNKIYLSRRSKEIKKWDYLLADSIIAKNKFTSSFNISSNIIKNLGYPRVEWLKRNRNNLKLKLNILKELEIDSRQKVLLYVPTWRDYEVSNQKDSFLNLDIIGEALEGYKILVKLHPLTKIKPSFKNIIYLNEYSDLQKYILIADTVISDYSSVIFDAIAIDIPVFLYMKDLDKYSKSIGLYEEIYNDLKIYKENHIEKLIEKIKNIQNHHIYDSKLKAYYTSSYIEESTLNIYNEIKKLMLYND